MGEIPKSEPIQDSIPPALDFSEVQEEQEKLDMRKGMLKDALLDEEQAAQLLVIAADIAKQIREEGVDKIDPYNLFDYRAIEEMLPMEGVYNGLTLAEAITAWELHNPDASVSN
ncbi:hypothetical protein HOG48_03490 [Candidatus Peregrinibacteria bacterium]|jgi:hypothetical protein|nr:hypothetical protein [Candidatus Peregrinibacteria bacterium]